MKIYIALPGSHHDHLTLEQDLSDPVLAIKKNIQQHFDDLELTKEKLRLSGEVNNDAPKSELDFVESSPFVPRSHFHLPEECQVLTPEPEDDAQKDSILKLEVAKPKKAMKEEKAKVHSEPKQKSSYSIESQTLVYKQTTLENERKIEEYEIKEGAIINLYSNETSSRKVRLRKSSELILLLRKKGTVKSKTSCQTRAKLL